MSLSVTSNLHHSNWLAHHYLGQFENNVSELETHCIYHSKKDDDKQLMVYFGDITDEHAPFFNQEMLSLLSDTELSELYRIFSLTGDNAKQQLLTIKNRDYFFVMVDNYGIDGIKERHGIDIVCQNADNSESFSVLIWGKVRERINDETLTEFKTYLEQLYFDAPLQGEIVVTENDKTTSYVIDEWLDDLYCDDIATLSDKLSQSLSKGSPNRGVPYHHIGAIIEHIKSTYVDGIPYADITPYD